MAEFRYGIILVNKGSDGVSNKVKIREDAMSLNPIDDALFMKMAED